MAETSQDSLYAQRLLYALRNTWEPIAVNLRTDPMTMEFRYEKPGVDQQTLINIVTNVNSVAQTIGWTVNEWRKRDNFIHIVAERKRTTQ